MQFHSLTCSLQFLMNFLSLCYYAFCRYCENGKQLICKWMILDHNNISSNCCWLKCHAAAKDIENMELPDKAACNLCFIRLERFLCTESRALLNACTTRNCASHSTVVECLEDGACVCSTAHTPSCKPVTARPIAPIVRACGTYLTLFAAEITKNMSSKRHRLH